MAVPGSDCVTGKRQYATFDAARRAATAHRAKTLRPFKCAWCLTWHTGNRRGHHSKARAR